MYLFNFNVEEMLTFFCVLVRFSVLFSILPFIGDRTVPPMVKVLMSLVVTVALFPPLLSTGKVHVADTYIWASTPAGIITTIVIEAFMGLVLGFTAKLIFDCIAFGANLVGNMMGFASASIYDPHQESQTEVIAQVQTTLAMLVFLAVDGHHLMLRAALDSYRFVGVGKATFGAAAGQRLVELSGEVFHAGLQLAAPVAISIFAVNVVFGVMAKSMPQLNVLVLSFSVTALVGLVVMLLGTSEFNSVSSDILLRVGSWMQSMVLTLKGGT
ncbi:MAG: flagellar biosynthetic protein FliR [Bdellovibrio sp.]|nr:flagellar biosynthetic protein FliR [Bdellovibrio sp.]